jgi:hypothetical protein
MRALVVLLAVAGCGFKSQPGAPDLAPAPADLGPPTPIVLARGLVVGGELALDAQNVYWLEEGPTSTGVDGAAYRVSKDGCPAIDRHCVDLLANMLALCTTITVGGTNVCWLESSSPHRLVSCFDLLSGGRHFTADDVDASDDAMYFEGGNLIWADINTGTNGAIVSLRAAAQNGSPATLLGMITNPAGLALDGNAFYWSDAATVWTAARDGTGRHALAMLQKSPLRLSLYNGYLYWVASDGVWRVPIDGSAAASQLSSTPNRILDLKVDASGVYWVGGTPQDFIDGVLMRADLDGGNAKALLDQLAFPISLALDDDWVYWVDAGTPTGNLTDGQVLKLKKPAAN